MIFLPKMTLVVVHLAKMMTCCLKLILALTFVIKQIVITALVHTQSTGGIMTFGRIVWQPWYVTIDVTSIIILIRVTAIGSGAYNMATVCQVRTGRGVS